MTGLVFQSQELWFLFLLVPLVFWLGVRACSAQRADVVSFYGLVQASRFWQGPVPGSRWFAALSAGATACVVLAVLRPVWGNDVVDFEKSSTEIVIALDVSESMMVSDVSPSRYERARRKITDLVQRAQGERIALVSFAGSASVESPLTEDPQALLEKLKDVDPELLPVAGSRIDLALYRSLEVLGYGRRSRAKAVDVAKPPEQSPSADRTPQEAPKTADDAKAPASAQDDLPTAAAQAIILVTDGESDPELMDRAIQRVKDSGIRVFVLGVGTPSGGPVPDQKNQSGFRRDAKGGLVTSRLAVAALERLANEGQGVFVQSVSDDSDVVRIYDRGVRAALVDATGPVGQQSLPRERFQIPLGAAFLLMLCLLILPMVRDRRITRGTTTLLAGLALLVGSLFPGPVARADDFLNRRDQQARRAYESGDFAGAAAAWKERLSERGSGAAASDYYNFGNALYRLGDYKAAAEAFRMAHEKKKQTQSQEKPVSDDKNEEQSKAKAKNIENEEADILHNLGNAWLQSKNFEDAIASYEQSLKLRPGDQATEQNLAYARQVAAQESQKKQQGSKNQGQPSQENQKPNAAQEQSDADSANASPRPDSESSQNPAPQQNSEDQAGAGTASKEPEKSDSQSQSRSETQSPSDSQSQSQSQSQSESQTRDKQAEGAPAESSTASGSTAGGAKLSRDEVEKALNRITDDATPFRKRRAASDAAEQIERYGHSPKGGPEW